MKRIPSLLFILIVIIVSLYYNYHEILFLRPQSIHHFRQTDCASVALNYYQNGMDFFKPEILNLHAEKETSGHSVGEFPIIYYIVAILYKIFGFNEFLYRGFNLLIFYIGLFYLFKLFYSFLKDNLLAMMFSLLFFTSPVIVYYANNFLPDIPAFSMVIIGWFYFFQFHKSKKRKVLYLSMLFFLLGGLLKVTSTINLIILIIILFDEQFTGIIFKKGSLVFSGRKKDFIPVISAILLILAWYQYAVYYKNLHASYYFSTKIWPIWKLTLEDINNIINMIATRWVYDYFQPAVLYVFLILYIVVLFFYKKTTKYLFWIIQIFLLGIVFFALLWFFAFRDHDYYLINLYLFPIFIIITSLLLLKHYLPVWFKSVFLKIILSAFLIFNIYYAQIKLDERYHSWLSEYPFYKDVHTITPYLRSIGIERTDKVISLPDQTGNYTLYLMNQPGWTNILRLNGDSSHVAGHIDKGAKYLVLVGDEVLNEAYLKPFLKKPVGQYNTVRIYDLH